MSENSTKRSVAGTIAQYGKQMFRFIQSRTKSLEDAEDILQDVWFQLSRLTNLDELENISAWLYSVSRNKITDSLRKKKPDALEDYTQTDDEGLSEIREILLMDTSSNPELELFKDVFWSELNKALLELPENQRKVFIENEMEDKTLQEIADQENENIKTIISRKGYAMKHLRKKLQPLYNDLLNK